MFVEELPPVPALPPPSTPEATDSEKYQTPLPFPRGIRRVCANSDQYAIYSSIENEDPIAISNVTSSEYEKPDDLKRGDSAVHKYETVGDSKRSNAGVGLDSNGYLEIIADLNQE